jgi:hypothetical protein
LDQKFVSPTVKLLERLKHRSRVGFVQNKKNNNKYKYSTFWLVISYTSTQASAPR